MVKMPDNTRMNPTAIYLVIDSLRNVIESPTAKIGIRSLNEVAFTTPTWRSERSNATYTNAVGIIPMQVATTHYWAPIIASSLYAPLSKRPRCIHIYHILKNNIIFSGQMTCNLCAQA